MRGLIRWLHKNQNEIMIVALMAALVFQATRPRLVVNVIDCSLSDQAEMVQRPYRSEI